MRVTVQLDLGEGVFEPYYGSHEAQSGDVIEHGGKGWKVTARIWNPTGSLLTLRCVEDREVFALYQERRSQQPALRAARATESEN